jgi:hypothetical protein
MTNFLHWRKMTWALLAWSGAMTAWILIGSVSASRVVVLWVAGMTFLSLLWLATQPLYQKGRGLSGIFVKPRRGQWRVLNLHRIHGGRPGVKAISATHLRG